MIRREWGASRSGWWKRRAVSLGGPGPLAEENHPRARAAEGLVGGGGDEVAAEKCGEKNGGGGVMSGVVRRRNEALGRAVFAPPYELPRARPSPPLPDVPISAPPPTLPHRRNRRDTRGGRSSLWQSNTQHAKCKQGYHALVEGVGGLPGRHEAGDVRHIHQQVGAALVRDLCPRIRTRTRAQTDGLRTNGDEALTRGERRRGGPGPEETPPRSRLKRNRGARGGTERVKRQEERSEQVGETAGCHTPGGSGRSPTRAGRPSRRR